MKQCPFIQKRWSRPLFNSISAHLEMTQRVFMLLFFCSDFSFHAFFCSTLCRKPEALWEAALATSVVPEGRGSIPALPEGTWTWRRDLAQATHQKGLVFLEASVLLSACLLKRPDLESYTSPSTSTHIEENYPEPLYKWINDPQS